MISLLYDGLWYPVRLVLSLSIVTLLNDPFSASSFKLLMIPIILWANWELLAPFVAKGVPNPFAPLIFISHKIPDSPPDDPRYRKGYSDLLFIAYYIIVWSWFRQVLTLDILRPIAKWYRIRKEAKLARFGEQGHAMVYFAIMGAWGIVSHLSSPL